MPLTDEQKAKLAAAKKETNREMHDQQQRQQTFTQTISAATLNLGQDLNDPLKESTVSTMGNSAKPTKGGCEIM
ncbi:hypothetical protein [Rickettsia endosymbiont of Gonocerus acuteangulatus]|uniref:hypothetical protein n=1 Tax=Rickettsia endosymbiont of Gonocerus acuteangulatus TaxID=3066266 RepID=UPI003132FF19